MVLATAEMLQFHHKCVMRCGAWSTHCKRHLKWECGPISLRPCPHHRGWASWASCGTYSALHQDPLVQLYLLVTSANRNAAQGLQLTFGVKSALCLQSCPYRHEFPNILLREFHREEIPLGEVEFLKKGKSFVSSVYKCREI